jgi:hypothetical protein
MWKLKQVPYQCRKSPPRLSDDPAELEALAAPMNQAAKAKGGTAISVIRPKKPLLGADEENFLHSMTFSLSRK